MENRLSLHLRQFNEKVKLMNQLNQKSLMLSASEARNLHADIFELLQQLASATKQHAKSSDIDSVIMDGGKF